MGMTTSAGTGTVEGHTATPLRITIPVSGMTCAACQARVQRTLQRTPGVADAAVNLMTASATVAYDPAVATPEVLVERIRATGYGADLPAAEGASRWAAAFDEQERQDEARAAEFRTLRAHAVIALVVAAIAMLLSMPLMAAN